MFQAGLADMVASAEAITADSEKYVEQLLNLFRRFSLLVSQVNILQSSCLVNILQSSCLVNYSSLLVW